MNGNLIITDKMDELETPIKNRIIDYLNSLKHCKAYETKTTGRRIGNKWVKPTARESAGKSDITCCYYGFYIALEVKTATGKQKDNQKSFENEIIDSRGQYWLVRSVDEVKQKIEDFRIIIKLFLEVMN